MINLPGTNHVGSNGHAALIKSSHNLDPADAKNELSFSENKAIDLETIAVNFECNDDKGFAELGEMLGKIKIYQKQIDQVVKKYTQPAEDYIGTIKSFAAVIVQHLKSAQVSLEMKGGRYVQQKQLAEREAEKRARAEAEAFQKKLDEEAKARGVEPIKIETAPVIKPQAEKIKTGAGTMTIKPQTIAEIINPKSRALFDYVLKVKKEQYIKLANQALNIAIKSGIEKMAGVKFSKIQAMSHRVTRGGTK